MKLAATKAGVTVEELIQKRSDGLKHCYKCSEWRSTDDFCSDKSRADGLSALCRLCRNVPPNERKNWKGRVSTFKGKTHTAEAKAKMSEVRKGKTSPKKGIPRSDKDKDAISKAVRAVKHKFSGPNCPHWKGGITPLNKALRKGTEYADWRTAVFTRDKFTCQRCRDNRGGNLHAHHIKSFSDHPDLRFDVSNGETLCHDCHEKHHGWKIGRKNKFSS